MEVRRFNVLSAFLSSIAFLCRSFRQVFALSYHSSGRICPVLNAVAAEHEMHLREV
jgi:hypothetical protein